MASLKTSILATAVAVIAPIGIVMPPATAAETGASMTMARVSDDLAPVLKTVQLVAGDTWRTKVGAKGFRQVKLQIKAASGPFRTVKTYRVPKKGRVKIVRAFPKAGVFLARTIAIRAGAGRDVKSKPVLITVVAKRYQGTFGGDHKSGTSWSGTVTYFYQERDPVTNQRWNDGAVHYTAVEGSVTWNYDASVLNGGIRRNCSAAPSTGQMGIDALDANMTVEQDVDKTYKGRRYDLNVYVVSAPRIQYTCEYLDYDIDGNPIWVPETRETSLQFGPNGGDLLTNSLSLDATGVSGRYTKSLSAPLVGDINHPAEAITNRWYWNLTTG